MTDINIEICCICLDDILPGKNMLTTECGHIFHCSCLMTNAAHNGFGCPYCRTEMAIIPDDDNMSSDEESIYDSDDESIDMESPFDDDVLTSFRMFHQRNDDSNIEPEPLFDEEEINIDSKPTAEYISEILIRQGVEVKDLVRCLLIDHEEYEDDHIINHKADTMFGRMRVIISNYVPNESVPRVPLIQRISNYVPNESVTPIAFQVL